MPINSHVTSEEEKRKLQPQSSTLPKKKVTNERTNERTNEQNEI